MDSGYSFRCNILRCRAVLDVEAVVTTCCHIYCTRCANDHGLLTGRRICPACQADLPNQDDLAIASMRPSTDYKASVLAGLGPKDIMECAQKAMYFYEYQAIQEVMYQYYLTDELKKSADQQEGRIVAIKAQKKTEVNELLQRAEKAENRVRVMNQDRIKQDQEAKNKDRQIEKLQRELNQIKQVTEVAPRMARAAAAEVEAETGHRRSEAHGGPRHSVKSGPPHFERNFNDTHSRSSGPPFVLSGRARRQDALPFQSRGGPVVSGAVPMETPQHTRKPILAQPTPQLGTHAHHSVHRSSRNPLRDIDENVRSQIPTGYGLSAGAKIGLNGIYGESASHMPPILPRARW